MNVVELITPRPKQQVASCFCLIGHLTCSSCRWCDASDCWLYSGRVIAITISLLVKKMGGNLQIELCIFYRKPDGKEKILPQKNLHFCSSAPQSCILSGWARVRPLWDRKFTGLSSHFKGYTHTFTWTWFWTGSQQRLTLRSPDLSH